MKEFFAFLMIANAIDKELSIRLKLLRHQNKMVEMYTRYKDFEFKNHAAKDWFDKLKQRVICGFD